MKKRFIAIILSMCLILVLNLSLSCGEVDYNSVYEYAIKLAGNDLSNLQNLQDAILALEQTGAYSYTKSYIMYFQALFELQNNEDYNTASLRLNTCNRQTGFVEDLQERNLPSCEVLLRYIDARRLEHEGKTEEAYYAFADLTVLDSPDRAFNLSLYISKKPSSQSNENTPTPIPSDETEEPETEDPDQPGIPILSETYPGSNAQLRKTGDEGFRVSSFAGPGKQYYSTGGYKPYKQRKITVYFEENGWVMADVQYQTVEERMVYLPKSSFGSIEDIPVISSPEYHEGKAKSNIVPKWGPDDHFNSSKELAVDKDTTLKVLFQENEYYYAEYTCAKGLVRMWLPINDVEIIQ